MFSHNYVGNFTDSLKPGSDLPTRLQAAEFDIWWGTNKLDDTRAKVAGVVRKMNKARDRRLEAGKKLKAAAVVKEEAERKWSTRAESVKFENMEFSNDFFAKRDHLAGLKVKLSDILEGRTAATRDEIDRLREWIETRETMGLELRVDIDEMVKQGRIHREELYELWRTDEFRLLKSELARVKREKIEAEKRVRAVCESYERKIVILKSEIVRMRTIDRERRERESKAESQESCMIDSPEYEVTSGIMKEGEIE